MDNTTWKREIMGLLMLPPERREQAVSDLLELLKCKDNTQELIKSYGEAVMN